MAKAKRPNDPRISETLKHIRLLARRHSRRPTVQDYLTYRAKHAPQLPSTSTLYRLFGGWPEALAEAGISKSGPQELSRTPDDALIAALKEAAEALGVTELSSHAYDDYRRRVLKKEKRKLPSSSVIRKWLGHWASAVKKAGLESPERAAPRRATVDEVIEGRTLFHDFMKRSDHLVKAGMVGDIRVHLETVVLEEGHHFPMILKFQVVRIPHIVEKSVELALRRCPRVQVAQSAGSGIPGVLQRLSRRLVIFGQHRQIHDAFALHLDGAIPVRNGQRHGFDRFDLG